MSSFLPIQSVSTHRNFIKPKIQLLNRDIPELRKEYPDVSIRKCRGRDFNEKWLDYILTVKQKYKNQDIQKLANFILGKLDIILPVTIPDRSPFKEVVYPGRIKSALS